MTNRRAHSRSRSVCRSAFRLPSRLWRSLSFLCVVVSGLGLVCWWPAVNAQPVAADNAAVPQEFQVKAAYIYNFLTFTEWSSAPAGGLQFCVYGPDPFGAALDTALAGKSISGRTLTLARITTVDQLTDCHIVFVSSEVSSNLPRVLEAINRNVLTIADSPGATAAGVVFNMTTESDRISFAVNLRAAHDQGFTISYRLLRLATEVIN